MNYDNTNKGALHKNDKGDNPNRPDYKGSLNVDGQEFWLSAWIRNKKDGSGKFMSLQIEPKQQQQQAPSKPRAKQASEVDVGEGDEIPF